MTGRVPMIIFKILFIYFFFENATPRINSVVLMFVFKLKTDLCVISPIVVGFVKRFSQQVGEGGLIYL